ncbi:MAG: SUMF1/EgtB/PvdO family nonheme iron enzyme [Bacteroidota bacterium]|nr:SUMF1/EgtB/PvdO family nonheme iron enzyme [Bacteroidota bacterium]
MKKFLLAGVGVILLCIIGTIIYYFKSDDYANDQHFKNGETEVFISIPPGATYQLFQAGNSLGVAKEMTVTAANPYWLSAGNYFVKVALHQKEYLYPISLTGFRCGPDNDGSFIVNCREARPEQPPVLLQEIPSFKYIPSGSFLFGDKQLPTIPHYVWLTTFYISPFEITNQEFRQFLNDPNGYSNQEWWTEAGRLWKTSNKTQVSAALLKNNKDYQRFGQPMQPVTWVNWFEANAFCKWLSKKIGNGHWLYSLPNEAEWEKASRGPDNEDYSLTMTISDDQMKLFNWKKNPDDSIPVYDIESTHMKYKPNRYGLFHTTGNVSEWTMSIHRSFNKKNPFQLDSRNLETSEGERVIRGGSWYSASIANLYISYRDAFPPQHSTQDVGFRIIAKLLP